jgi:hypothetical protein
LVAAYLNFWGTSCSGGASGVVSSLYSLGTDSVENTVSNSSLIVAFVFVAAETSYHVLFIGRSLSKAISSGPLFWFSDVMSQYSVLWIIKLKH